VSPVQKRQQAHDTNSNRNNKRHAPKPLSCRPFSFLSAKGQRQLRVAQFNPLDRPHRLTNARRVARRLSNMRIINRKISRRRPARPASQRADRRNKVMLLRAARLVGEVVNFCCLFLRKVIRGTKNEQQHGLVMLMLPHNRRRRRPRHTPNWSERSGAPVALDARSCWYGGQLDPGFWLCRPGRPAVVRPAGPVHECAAREQRARRHRKT
jgi:hypothetical protein